MTLKELDFYFPFVVFFYGAIMMLFHSLPTLRGLSEAHYPNELHQRPMATRPLAVISLFLGGFWSLQNLWIGL